MKSLLRLLSITNRRSRGGLRHDVCGNQGDCHQQTADSAQSTNEFLNVRFGSQEDATSA